MLDVDLPARSIETYEKSTGFSVTLHHLDTRLWSILPPRWSWHDSTACRAVKQHGDSACMAFDLGEVRARLVKQPAGFVKVCHAGLVEWVVGVTLGEHRPAMVLFAGQALAGEGLESLSPLTADTALQSSKLPMRVRLPRVDATKASHELERLAQLGARLEQWLAAMMHQGQLGAAARPQPARDAHRQRNNIQRRRQRIEFFMRSRHVQNVTIDDLAQELDLSPGRAAHVVTQTCGSSFGQLLTQARLRTAASLLSHTTLSVLDVALQSGFGDVSHFHRCFRKAVGVSPLQYRKRVEVMTPLTISV